MLWRTHFNHFVEQALMPDGVKGWFQVNKTCIEISAWCSVDVFINDSFKGENNQFGFGELVLRYVQK